MLLLVLFALTLSSAAEESPKLLGENVCIEQTPKNVTTKISYMESHDVKEYTWCLKVPPRCPVWKTKMTKK